MRTMQIENRHAYWAWLYFIVGTLCVFLLLRVTNRTDWPWWAVLSPIWVPAGSLACVTSMLVVWYYIRSFFGGKS